MKNQIYEKNKILNNLTKIIWLIQNHKFHFIFGIKFLRALIQSFYIVNTLYRLSMLRKEISQGCEKGTFRVWTFKEEQQF